MNRVVLFVLLCGFWVLLTWPDGSGPSIGEVGIGMLAALLVTWVMGEATGTSIGRWLDPRRYLWAVVYMFVLAGFVIRANLEVAYRVLHPQMPIRPGIVRVKTRLVTPAARAVLGNSITLCPGTLTMDIRDDGTMLIHCIYVHDPDDRAANERIVERYEWFIERIFE